MKIKKGDHVVVVAGRDKGRTGLVIAAYPDRGKVLVQGVNVVTKNKKVTYQGQRAAKEGENPVEVETGLGHLRFEQQKWEEAARCYTKVIELEPKHRTAHYNLGLVLERQGQFAEASKAFANALEVDPKRWQARLGLGVLVAGERG